MISSLAEYRETPRYRLVAPNARIPFLAVFSSSGMTEVTNSRQSNYLSEAVLQSSGGNARREKSFSRSPDSSLISFSPFPLTVIPLQRLEGKTNNAKAPFSPAKHNPKSTVGGISGDVRPRRNTNFLGSLLEIDVSS